MRRIYSLVTPMLMALALPFCAAPIRSTMRPLDAPPASLWIEPIDLDTRDLQHCLAIPVRSFTRSDP